MRHETPVPGLRNAAEDWMGYFRHRRREILAVAGLNVLTWFIFIAHFMLQNHSITFPWVPLDGQFFAGRWFTSVLFWLNGGANIPVITILLAISFNLLTVVLAVRLWGGQLRGLKYFLVLCLFTLYPAFTESYYFHYASPAFMASITLSVLALLMASRLSALRLALGSLLVCFSLATYQPALSSLSTVFMAFCLASVMIALDGNESAGTVFKLRTLPRLLVIGLGGILYMLSLVVMGSPESHATTTIAVAGLYDQFGLVMHESFAYLVRTQPEFPRLTKLALLALVLAAFILILVRCLMSRDKGMSRITLILGVLLLAFGLVLATKAMFLVSDMTKFFPYRYNQAYAFLYTFSLLLLLSYPAGRTVDRIAVGLALVLVIRFVQVDLLRQGVLLRGQIHDLSLANRILYRIETLPGIDYTREYVLVRVGDYPPYRAELLAAGGRKSDYAGSEAMDSGYITADFAAGSVMNLLGSSVRFNPYFNHDWLTDEAAALAQIREEGRKPWPHLSSVFINGDRIIVYMRN